MQPSPTLRFGKIVRASGFSTMCTKGRFTWGPKSQVQSLNMEAKCQLLSLKKPLKYGFYSLQWDLGYFIIFVGLGLRVGSSFFAQSNSQHKSQASPPESVAIL